MSTWKNKMDVINQKHITIAEARNILDKKRKGYKEQNIEMLYEQKRALDHANKSAKLNLRDSTALAKKISELEIELNDEQIIKIVDLLPETVDDVRAIFTKERFRYEGEEIKSILDIVAQYK